MDSDGFNLSDFLGGLGSAYSTYTAASSAADVAKINQQTAATEAAANNALATSNAQLKQYAIYGGIALAALIVVGLAVKLIFRK